MSKDNQYISQAEAARQLGLTRQAVAYLIEHERLQADYIAGRYVLTQSEVDRYARERVPPGWEGYHKRLKLQEKK